MPKTVAAASSPVEIPGTSRHDRSREDLHGPLEQIKPYEKQVAGPKIQKTTRASARWT